jgi:hypothetical protein
VHVCSGSVEYLAPESYQVRLPMEPWHAFVIDATHNALHSGTTASMCAATSAAIEALAKHSRVRVALVAYSEQIMFLSFSREAPSMLTVADIEVHINALQTVC